MSTRACLPAHPPPTCVCAPSSFRFARARAAHTPLAGATHARGPAEDPEGKGSLPRGEISYTKKQNPTFTELPVLHWPSPGHPEMRVHGAYLGGTHGPDSQATGLEGESSTYCWNREWRSWRASRRSITEWSLMGGTGTTEANKWRRERVQEMETPAGVRAW